MPLLLNELYTAPQGEGPRAGQMVQFVRFAGCNMRCPGWPCDTQHASDPALWRHDHKRLTSQELFDQTEEWPRAVCLTGGEPFMQNNILLKEYVEILDQEGYKIEAFTNGSFVYPDWVWYHDVRLIMDWKLKGSGEAETTLDNRFINARHLTKHDVIKFVVTGEEDLDEALEVYYKLRSMGVHTQFSVGAAWGKFADADLVEWLLNQQIDWSLNMQLHKHIYNPNQRGI